MRNKLSYILDHQIGTINKDLLGLAVYLKKLHVSHNAHNSIFFTITHTKTTMKRSACRTSNSEEFN